MPLINYPSVPKRRQIAQYVARFSEGDKFCGREDRTWVNLREAVTGQPLKTIETRKLEAPCIDVADASFPQQIDEAIPKRF